MDTAIQNRPRLFSNKDLRKLIIPLVIEQVLALTVGLADVVMVSSVGENAVSGVSLVDMLNSLFINVFSALATGGAVVTSQLIGAQDHHKANDSAKQLLFVTLLTGLVIMGAVILWQRPMLRLLFGSIDDDVMQNALTYLFISALSYPFLAVYNSGAALFRSMGNSKISMALSLLMNGINIVGNAICVYGMGMGIAGVALPSLISRGVAAVGILWLLLRSHGAVRLEFHSGFRPDMGLIRRILRIGIPNGLENSLFSLGRVLVVSIIATFGTVQIAANAVANNFDGIGCIPAQAINLAVITVIGQCVGAQDEQQIRYYTKKLMGYAYLFEILLNVVLLSTLSMTLKIYNLSPETMRLSTILIFIHDGFAMLMWPLSFTLPNVLRACNDVRFTMIVSIFSMWTFRILFSYIIGVHFGLGAIGVWIAMLLDWAFRIICFVWRYLSGKWRSLCLASYARSKVSN